MVDVVSPGTNLWTGRNECSTPPFREMTMTFQITIDSSDDALTGDMKREELAGILGSVATKVRNGQSLGTVRDSNGNRVGKFEVDWNEYEEDIVEENDV